MTDRTPRLTIINRRRLLAGVGAGLVAAALPFPALADPEDADAAIKAMFGDRPIQDGRVKVGLPPIAENGNSVALNITVDSPMSHDDYVKQIAVFSPRNPEAEIAVFKLGPRAGKADVSTRIRMAGTQTLRVIAEMNDGSLWKGTGSTVVTLAACVIG